MENKRDSNTPNAPSAKTPPKIGNTAQNGGPDRIQKQIKVLIVDDKPLIFRSLQRIVRKEAEVVGATDGHETLRVLKEDSNFDLIILDLEMPELMGTDVVRKLKEEGKQDLIDRIVIHSGTLADHLDADVREMVEGRVLPKPSEISVLLGLLQYAKKGRVKEWRAPKPTTEEGG